MPRIPLVGNPRDALDAAQRHARELVELPGTLAALPGTLTALNRTVRGLSESVGQARDAMAALQQLAGRLDALLDDVEPSVRALAPGMDRLATALDDPVVSDLPETLRQLRDDALPAVRGLRETQERVAGIAASTERLMSFMDETGGRLAGLPAAALLLSRRAARPVDPRPPGPSQPPAP